ncbi:MAG: glutamine--fructose-6-phosphate transaminase (isomerizing) [Anaerolineaceae bacterium]|nr:glutamine--fructose-6-phosphate transaminase (isomerizing) [Anaerolineaceae bacterium]
MCGIVGYVGAEDATQRLLNGLEQLAYRGYDSAGIAVLSEGELARRRTAGKLSNLRQVVAASPLQGSPGIGHTRWATHGDPTRENAHPHFSMAGDFAVVHNGIVENYQPLRAELTAEGIVFRSQTDSEIIVQLIALYAAQFGGDGAVALRAAAQRLHGAGAVVMLSRQQPDRLVALRLGNAGGIALGLGEDGGYLASDIPALLPHSRNLLFLEDGQLATLRADRIELQSMAGEALPVKTERIAWGPMSATRGRYKHFMLKEVFDQPRSIADTLGGRIDLARGEVALPELAVAPERAQRLRRLVIVACGSSYYSALAGKFFFEHWARLPTEVDYGSEFRYRQPPLDENTAVLAITQSGETADTLAAMEEVRAGSGHNGVRKGADRRPGAATQPALWCIVNAPGSQAQRMADCTLLMRAGPEIGVASSKTFTASIVAQQLLALALAGWRETITAEERAARLRELSSLPALMGEVLAVDPLLQQLAGRLYAHQHFLYLGRGSLYPIALEGALKLKEISYIHAEGYPAGEMKHGPIALLDEKMPSLLLALQNGMYEKVLSQLSQLRARGGKVVVMGTSGDDTLQEQADEWIPLPSCAESIQPILATLPLQLLAYHIAVHRGADVDQPRNLAKSVTVE